MDMRHEQLYNVFELLQDNSTMLMEASRGGHTKVVQLLIDFPNSISHLLPVVAQTHPSVAGSSSGATGELTATGPLLEGDPHHLSMGLAVVPGSDPQAHVVLNANQPIFNDIGRLLPVLRSCRTVISLNKGVSHSCMVLPL